MLRFTLILGNYRMIIMSSKIITEIREWTAAMIFFSAIDMRPLSFKINVILLMVKKFLMHFARSSRLLFLTEVLLLNRDCYTFALFNFKCVFNCEFYHYECVKLIGIVIRTNKRVLHTEWDCVIISHLRLMYTCTTLCATITS